MYVIYAVDVSGSTDSGAYDCNNDGVAADSDDDLNEDGRPGTTLDCEIAGVIALNTSLSAIPGSEARIKVGVVPFGSSAAIANVNGAGGAEQQFVSPQADVDSPDPDRDRLADIVQVASSLDTGEVRLFTQKSVGGGTSFDAALASSFAALDGKTGQRLAFLLSDGFSSISDATIAQGKAISAEVRPFAIGQGSDGCAEGGPLDKIGDSFGSPCVYAPDPTTLAAAISGQPSALDRLEVQLDSNSPVRATVDPLGNFTADLNVGSGNHVIKATAFYKDGRSATSSVNISSTASLRYLALGDSYSAGEGLPVFRSLPGPKRGCHQSVTGFATRVGQSGYELPSGNPAVLLDYQACSGAVSKNLLSVPQQARDDSPAHAVQLDRLSSDTDLVSLSVGGNDLGFSNVLAHCATQENCQDDGYARLSSGRDLTLDEFLTARLALFQPEVEQLYRIIRQRSGGDSGSVVAFGYPELIDDGTALRAGCKELLAFGRGERLYLNQSVARLRDALSSAAAAAGINFVDLVAPFKGHRVCDGGVNTQSEWLTGHETTAKKIAGDASFHPDQDGADAIAREITKHMRDLVAGGRATNRAGMPVNPQPRTTSARSAENPNTVAASLGLSESEMAEIGSIEFGQGEIEGLSARRGSAECGNGAALGEQLIFAATGFVPGSTVTIHFRSSSEAQDRTGPSSQTVRNDGSVEFSYIVPKNLPATAGRTSEQPWASILIQVDGQADGGARQVSDVIFVEPPGSSCAGTIAAAGDISPDGVRPAPSAESTPGTPAVVPIVLPPDGIRIINRAGGVVLEADVANEDFVTIADASGAITKVSGTSTLSDGRVVTIDGKAKPGRCASGTVRIEGADRRLLNGKIACRSGFVRNADGTVTANVSGKIWDPVTRKNVRFEGQLQLIELGLRQA